MEKHNEGKIRRKYSKGREDERIAERWLCGFFGELLYFDGYHGHCSLDLVSVVGGFLYAFKLFS